MRSLAAKVVTDTPVAAVRRITLNRPEVMNAIDDETQMQLHGALDEALADSGVRAIILAGAGANFSAGGDIQFLQELDREAFAAFHGRLLDLCEVLGTADKPLVGALRGACVGGALGIALACDQLVASETTRFVMPFLRIGLTPDVALPYWLARRVGVQRARDLILRDEPVMSDQAMAIGMCDRVAADADVEGVSISIASHLAGLAPLALRQTRHLLRSCSLPFDEYLAVEKSAAGACLGGPEFREGVAAFFEKRPPIWPEAKPEDGRTSSVRNTAGSIDSNLP